MASIYTVAQVNSYIKNMFAQDYLLSSVSVKGEVSNLTYHAKGHIYFTLKDKLSVISCVMWASNRKGLSFSLTEGMQIIVTFGELKQELEDRGMFAPEYKLPIPKTCRTLGVVTAPTGAAIRDIISISKSRDPYIQIVLYPALVQGEGAAASIVKGIKALEEYGVDTMIVGRGGGSIEDLWAFNEEIVAQAIFDCSIPIISAVGHETDTTIADYVADARAETPSAAAQMAVRDIAHTEEVIASYEEALRSRMYGIIERKRLYIQNREAVLSGLSPKSKIREQRFFLIQSEEGLKAAMKRLIEDRRTRLALAARSLQGVSPLEKLSQGFSFTETEDGRCVSDVEMLKPGDRIKVHVLNGRIDASVDSAEKVARI